MNRGIYRREVEFTHIDEALQKASGQYRSLLAAEPDRVGLPFAVVLFTDFFADHLYLYPRRMEAFPDVSGILSLEEDRLIREAAHAMSLGDLKTRIDSGSMKGLPPNTKEFRLLRNECARNPLPAHFVMACIES